MAATGGKILKYPTAPVELEVKPEDIVDSDENVPVDPIITDGSIAIMGGTAAVYHLDRSPRYGVRFNPKAITQRSLEASELLRKTGDDAYEHFVFPVAKARIKNQENDEIGVEIIPWMPKGTVGAEIARLIEQNDNKGAIALLEKTLITYSNVILLFNQAELVGPDPHLSNFMLDDEGKVKHVDLSTAVVQKDVIHRILKLRDASKKFVGSCSQCLNSDSPELAQFLLDHGVHRQLCWFVWVLVCAPKERFLDTIKVGQDILNHGPLRDAKQLPLYDVFLRVFDLPEEKE